MTSNALQCHPDAPNFSHKKGRVHFRPAREKGHRSARQPRKARHRFIRCTRDFQHTIPPTSPCYGAISSWACSIKSRHGLHLPGHRSLFRFRCDIRASSMPRGERCWIHCLKSGVLQGGVDRNGKTTMTQKPTIPGHEIEICHTTSFQPVDMLRIKSI